MKPSKYNLFVRAPDVVYAVNLLSRAAITLSPTLYDAYLALATGDNDVPELNEFERMLRKHCFLVDDDFDEIDYIRYRVNRERFDTRQLGLVIAPTLGCNFNCHYCFERKSEKTLNLSMQKQLLKLVASRIIGREQLDVQWFGGEPLQALEVIEELSQHLKQLAAVAGARYTATIVTNGYFLTNEVAGLLRELGVTSAQISLDGDKPLHDRTRFEHPDEGSFDVILENIRQSSRYLAIKVRVHVAPFSVSSVLQLIDRLGKEQMMEHIAELYFAPLFNYHSEMVGPAYVPDAKRFMTSQDFAGFQIAMHEKARFWGFKLPDFLDVSYGICTAVRDNTLVIDPDGYLFKCYKDVNMPRGAVGTAEAGVSINQNLINWMDVDIPRDDEC